MLYWNQQNVLKNYFYTQICLPVRLIIINFDLNGHYKSSLINLYRLDKCINFLSFDKKWIYLFSVYILIENSNNGGEVDVFFKKVNKSDEENSNDSTATGVKRRRTSFKNSENSSLLIVPILSSKYHILCTCISFMFSRIS